MRQWIESISDDPMHIKKDINISQTVHAKDYRNNRNKIPHRFTRVIMFTYSEVKANTGFLTIANLLNSTTHVHHLKCNKLSKAICTNITFSIGLQLLPVSSKIVRDDTQKYTRTRSHRVAGLYCWNKIALQCHIIEFCHYHSWHTPFH